MGPVVIIGANGQLGSDLCRQGHALGQGVVPLTRSQVDLRDHSAVDSLLSSISPEVIVNTAAFHKLEACEADVEQTFAVNAFAVRNLAQVSDRIGAHLVHFSTDYVFDGTRGRAYTENDQPNPINTYGTSKIAGEFFVRSLSRRHLVIRTSGLYGVAGSSGKGGNFVQTMLKLGKAQGIVSVVTDQVLSPTFTQDLAGMVWRLIEADAEGLFHVTNSGACSWHEFARAIFEIAGVQAEVKPVTTSEMGTGVRRPAYSVLANDRLDDSGLGRLRSWREALRNYLELAGVIPQPTLGVKSAAT